MSRDRTSGWLARLGAALVALHGVVHVVGFSLLWELAEIGEFTYDMATPDAGTVSGRIVGTVWLIAAVLFVVAAVELLRDRNRWQQVALAGCIVSTPVLLIDAGDAFAGLVVNLAIVAVAFEIPRRVRVITRETTAT